LSQSSAHWPDDLTIGVETTLRLTDTTMLEPDIAVFPKVLFRRSTAGFAQLNPEEARLVIEVANTRLAYDKVLKAPLYARQMCQRVIGSSTPTSASPGSTPAQAGTNGPRSSKCGRDEALTTPSLPDFSIKLSQID
jgi:hypothetical protein